MKLKKLELSGFKSFLDKASITFPEGISAVVGPNGCGKSNIVDALRWVMGEQSVKQLRGKSMDDVIFAGTRGHAPLNMAEVSLVLANDNGSGPEALKDFSEVMITRRQYRSGEREYFLNKQPCRLKDIHNIFLGSGMGARSYAVISQGNIGAITDAGPEERRSFIEEAAGVTRYKNRRAEALKKVDATNQNLLRVNDIIQEVTRQMNSLNRQAAKAERFKNLQAGIKEFEVLLSIHHFDALSGKIEEADTILRTLKDRDIAHSSEITRLDAAIERIRFEQSRKSREISSQVTRKSELQRATDKIENDLDHLRKDKDTLAVEIQGLETVRVDLDLKNHQIYEDIGEEERNIKELEQTIHQEKSTLENEQQSTGGIRERLDALKEDLEQEKKRLMTLVAEEAKYQNIYQTASNNKESLKRRLKRIDEEEVTAGQKVADLEKNQNEKQKDLQTLKEELADLTDQITSVEIRLDEKNKELVQRIKEVQTQEFERSKIKSKYTTLMKMQDNFEWYKDGVKAIMKRGAGSEAEHDGIQPDKPSGVLGLTADIISPMPGYETAVEAALGESLQYILVKDQETGVDAIDYLQMKEAGRSGFIPVSAVKNGYKRPDGAPSSHNYLLNSVVVEPGYELVAHALLGNVLIAETLSEAIFAWNSSNGSGPVTVVTKNGHMVSNQGLMIGGSQDRLSGILLKKQEIKALEGRLSELDQLLEKGREDQRLLESVVRSLESDLQKLIEEKNIANREETEAEKALYKATEDLKHARQHLDIVRLEQEQLMGEESDIDDEMLRYNKAIQKNNEDVTTAQNNVAGLTGEINTLSQQLETYNKRVVDIQMKLTTLAARLESSRNTLKRLKSFQEDGISRMAQLSSEIEQKTLKRTEAVRRIDAYDQKLPGMYEAYKQAELDLEKNEADFQSIEQSLKENDKAISEIKTQREGILEKRRLLELEQSQNRIKQDNIAQRIEERYHQHISVFRSEMADAINTGEKSVDEMEAALTDLKEKISKIGDVNLGAIEAYEENKTRHEFLVGQREDLHKALDDLQTVIRKINRITKDRFLSTLDKVNEKLTEVFPQLFNGGSAQLVLTEPNNPLETGVEFMIHPPGKKLTRLSLLSGGEKALSAIAFIFSIFLLKPASFCLMDEIDAPLDEANVFRFNELMKIIGRQSQIIMITHNKRSMEFADTLFGVTMEKKGVSKIVSVNLDRAVTKAAA